MQRQILSAAVAALSLGAALLSAQPVQAQQSLPECQKYNSVYILTPNKSDSFGRQKWGEAAVNRMGLNWVILVQRCNKTEKGKSQLAVEAIGFEKIKDPGKREYIKEEFTKQSMWTMRLL